MSGFPFEAPVWWDPRARDRIYKPRDFHPCLLLADDAAFYLADERDLIATDALGGVSLEWPRFSDLPVCDLVVGGEVFRLWFSMPHPKSPEFEQATIATIDGVVGSHVPDGRVGAVEFSPARLPAWTHLHIGKKRLEQFTELVAR